MRTTTLRHHDPATPHLSGPSIDSTTTAVALLLHGGREIGTGPVRAWQGAVLRMRAFGSEIRRADPSVAVASLRYRARGWNGDGAGPLADVAWALDALRATVGQVPVVLVGHSMGGRAALRAAGDPSVTGVVALAPWLPRHEPVAQLAGRDVVVLHGTRDRTTNPFGTAAFAERAATEARAVVSLRLTGTGHTMLTRAHAWHYLTARYVSAVAAGTPIEAVDIDVDGVQSTRTGAA